jgi:hypothetical protein
MDMKRIMTVGLAMLAGLMLAGCATTGGSGESSKIWTYNLQQALARSGGDVAMTMVLDQGVNKKDAVGLVEAIIVFIESSDATVALLNAKLADMKVKQPQFAKFIDKLSAAIPGGAAGAIPPDVKAVLLSFLRDGAVYGATCYKDGMKLKMVPANENLRP